MQPGRTYAMALQSRLNGVWQNGDQTTIHSPVKRVPAGPEAKAFLTFSPDMASFLNRAAFVKASGRQIKVDEVSFTLSCKARVLAATFLKAMVCSVVPNSKVFSNSNGPLVTKSTLASDGFLKPLNTVSQPVYSPPVPSADMVQKQTFSTVQQIIPISRAFRSILKDLDHCQSYPTPQTTARRSARIRAKKMKTLGIHEQQLKEEDVFFINSLTAGEIARLAGKCGLILPEEETTTPILLLKNIEIQRCSLAAAKPRA
ncbi:hypothetical protein COCNU_scaffold019429G000030 [Cocos nucifera]|nr:hypothetical protein [Cocos nucifera]